MILFLSFSFSEKRKVNVQALCEVVDIDLG
jgi:hypothetical protein